jgi:hypothetical protein
MAKIVAIVDSDGRIGIAYVKDYQHGESGVLSQKLSLQVSKSSV